MGMEIIISVVLLLVGIAVLVIIHVCIVSRALDRDSHVNGSININVVQRTTIIRRSIKRVSREDIKKLPSFLYTVEDVRSTGSSSSQYDAGGGSSNTPGMECAVCLENFRVGEECRMLPKCKHCFHAECIDLWLPKAAVCPICRTEAFSQTIGVQNNALNINQIQSVSAASTDTVVEIV